MKFLSKFALAACLSASIGAAHAELITNGSFETGNFSGWTTVNNGGTGGCGSNVWVVNSTGVNGCTNNSKTQGVPTAGNFAAFNTFDGDAVNYTLSQTIALPGSISAATLSFMDESIMAYSGALRSFRVDLFDATNTTLLFNFYLEQPGTNSNTPWTTHSMDVTADLLAYAGQNVTLRFSNIIPQAYSGPAGFGLDNISLVAQVPEPTTLAMLGLGLLGLASVRRRKQ